MAQPHQNRGWRPVNSNLLLASRTHAVVKVSEIQQHASDFQLNYCSDQPDRCTVKPYPCHDQPERRTVKPYQRYYTPYLCNFKSGPCIERELGEVELPHIDIPLHRTPGTTDLTQSNPDFREAPKDDHETKPSIDADKSELREVKPDVLFKSNQVLSLNRHNFHPFVDNKEIALILFYQPDMQDNSQLLNTFAVAACSTKRAGHAYAAVNCLTDHLLCLSNHVSRTPTITLYSFGNVVGSFPFNKRTQETQLRNFVEHAHAFLPQRGRV